MNLKTIENIDLRECKVGAALGAYIVEHWLLVKYIHTRPSYTPLYAPLHDKESDTTAVLPIPFKMYKMYEIVTVYWAKSGLRGGDIGACTINTYAKTKGCGYTIHHLGKCKGIDLTERIKRHGVRPSDIEKHVHLKFKYYSAYFERMPEAIYTTVSVLPEKGSPPVFGYAE